MIEAKAHISEIVSPPTGAKDKGSLRFIKKSLEETKNYVGSNSKADWSSYFYQYTNRLAHLYYLKVLNNIPAYLIFVYFVGDKEMHGPNTKEEWQAGIEVMETYLGINKNHKLSKYIKDIFIDVKDIC